uniref:Uncharacterized protein n=1 Tax=Anopheles atroparvus TaxID=41427 RepID=A0AAG5DHL1_ANOAO
MAEASFANVKPCDISTKEPNPITDLEVRSDTSEDSSTKDTFRYFHYGYRSSNCSDDDDDDDDEEDPYQELFMNAYRSVPASSDEDDDRGKCTNNNNYPPEAKPLSLMEDWELWDSMDENELKEKLKNHPKLLEEITRNRKRKLLDEDENAGENEDLNEMMNRFVKYIRRDPTNVTS